MQFDWDEHNIAHIARHDVTPPEAEQVVANNPVELLKENRDGELRLRMVGRTDLGRVLIVVTTVRDSVIRVVTAHRAKRRLADYYVSIRRPAP